LTELSFRQGRPPLLRDEDIDLKVPSHLRDRGVISEPDHLFADDDQLGGAQRSLFVYHIELSKLLQALAHLVHSVSDLETLEKRALQLEEDVSQEPRPS